MIKSVVTWLHILVVTVIYNSVSGTVITFFKFNISKLAGLNP